MKFSTVLVAAVFAVTLNACHRKPANRDTATTKGAAAKPIAGPSTSPSASEQPAIGLSIDGVLLSDTVTRVARQKPFGSDQFELTQEIGKAIGNFTGQAENPDCGAGPLTSFDYPGGLTLFFQDRKFAGWDFDGEGKFATVNGITIGTTLADLRAKGEVAVQDSTIGHEFALGDLHGLLDATTPAGKVTNLWAGATCVAR